MLEAVVFTLCKRTWLQDRRAAERVVCSRQKLGRGLEKESRGLRSNNISVPIVTSAGLGSLSGQLASQALRISAARVTG